MPRTLPGWHSVSDHEHPQIRARNWLSRVVQRWIEYKVALTVFGESASYPSNATWGGPFKVEKNGMGDHLGIEFALAYRVTATGTTFVRDTGVVTTSGTAPGPDTVYTDVWAPNAVPPIPETHSARRVPGRPARHRRATHARERVHL